MSCRTFISRNVVPEKVFPCLTLEKENLLALTIWHAGEVGLAENLQARQVLAQHGAAGLQ